LNAHRVQGLEDWCPVFADQSPYGDRHATGLDRANAAEPVRLLIGSGRVLPQC
jgi:hypothetical protein